MLLLFFYFHELHPSLWQARLACREWAMSGGTISSVSINIRRINGKIIKQDKTSSFSKGERRSCLLDEPNKVFLGLYREKETDFENFLIYKKFQYK